MFSQKNKIKKYIHLCIKITKKIEICEKVRWIVEFTCFLRYNKINFVSNAAKFLSRWILLPPKNAARSLTQMRARAYKMRRSWGRRSVGSVAMKTSQVLLSCVVLGLAAAHESSPLDAAYGMVRSCGDAPVTSCIKRSAIVLVDAALDAGDTPLFTGLTLVRASPSPSESFYQTQ